MDKQRHLLRAQEGEGHGQCSSKALLDLLGQWENEDRTMLAKHSLRGLAALTAQRHAEGIGRCYGPQLALSRVILQPSGALTLDPSQGDASNVQLEERMYQAPEEEANARKGVSPQWCQSGDIYRLGLLLYEALQSQQDGTQRGSILHELRSCSPSRQCMLQYPEESSLVVRLTNPDPDLRPSIEDVVSMFQQESSQSVSSNTPTQRFVERLKDLSAHLKVVSMRQESQRASIRKRLAKYKSLHQMVKEEINKRKRNQGGISVHISPAKRKADNKISDHHGNSLVEHNIDIESMDERLEKAHDKLEESFRNEVFKQTHGQWNVSNEQFRNFASRLAGFARFNQVVERANIFPESCKSSMVHSSGFDRDGKLFGVTTASKQLKVFEMANIESQVSSIHLPTLRISFPSVLSSICWNPYLRANVGQPIATGRLDGVLSIVDVERGNSIHDFPTRAGRMWSVHISQDAPGQIITASKDGCLRLWRSHQQSPLLTIPSPAGPYCAQFWPGNANLLVAGCADRAIYVYDIRNVATPVKVFQGHDKSVTAVRFLSTDHLISASVDGSLALWRMTGEDGIGDIPGELEKRFTDHKNEERFLGLSVKEEGYIAFGSEDGNAVIYHNACSSPVAKFAFEQGEREELVKPFITSLSFNPVSHDFLASDSTGKLKLLKLT